MPLSVAGLTRLINLFRHDRGCHFVQVCITDTEPIGLALAGAVIVVTKNLQLVVFGKGSYNPAS